MLADEIRDIASGIGVFYHNKNNGDHLKANQEILSLLITEISVDCDTVAITTGRPGLIIGYHGKNIENLSEFLKKKIFIHEDQNCLYDAMSVKNWDEDEDEY